MSLLDFMPFRQKPDPTRGTGHVFNPYGKNSAPQRQQQGGGWMNKPALGGSMSRGDLLLASMGMLSGRNFQEGMANAGQYMAYGMDRANERQKEQQQKAALAKAMQGMDLTPQQRALMGINPGGVTNALTERAFAQPAGPDYGFTNVDGVLYRTDKTSGGAEALTDRYTEPQGPMSTIGKLRADLDANRITPQEYEIALARLQKEDPSLSVQFGEGGALSGITYGSSNRGKDAALVRTPDNTPAVSPGEQQARYNKVLATNKTLDVSDQVVTEDIDRAVNMAGAWTTGFLGAKLEDLQGTPAHDLKMLMQSIKANVGFDKLQQMRDNSPTGGALGQVTELELGLLQSVYGALEQSQTKEQFVYNLQRLKDTKQKFATLRQEAFAMDYPDLQTTAQFRSDANQQVQDWTDADEARLRELEALAGGQQQ